MNIDQLLKHIDEVCDKADDTLKSSLAITSTDRSNYVRNHVEKVELKKRIKDEMNDAKIKEIEENIILNSQKLSQ